MFEGRPEPPFRVLMAGYVVDFHHRDACTRCLPDGSCLRLAAAAETLRVWRDRPDRQPREPTTHEHGASTDRPAQTHRPAQTDRGTP
ncbi:hypothetical protein [Micromonospora humidisoli]|uniref:4Fe-4S Wbl-type domain-containing protein n=1 Tax=Micromonospora humidisoli TaxID=2807622 RepID=A0ABS2J5S7_9ACTN|nr:hypothetical protein [Micromonospora humidisoli]MBM7081491.1 hypothetical protein [Micromonospora humidisoli]